MHWNSKNNRQFFSCYSRVSLQPKESALPAKDLEKYLGSGLVVFNLDTGQIIYNSVLEVTKASNLYNFIFFLKKKCKLKSNGFFL